MTTDPKHPGSEQDARNVMDRLADSARVTREEARMPDKQLTKEQQGRLRAAANKWRKENGISILRLAQRLEVSKTTVSQVLSGNYRADPSRFLLAIDQHVTNPESPQLFAGPEPVGLVDMSPVIDMETAVEHARRIGTCCLIFGPSGYCKTTYAQARAKEKTNCIYVDLDDENYSRPRLLRRIAESLRVTEPTLRQMNSDAVFKRICSSLQGLSRVIFIDNAHVLNKHNLWVLHSIHNKTKSTIVCIGQPELYNTVLKSRQDDSIGATIFSRFGIKLDLSDAVKSQVDPTDGTRVIKPQREYVITVDDVNKFLAARRIKVHPAGVEWLHKLVNCPREGGFHTAEDILALAMEAYCEAKHLTLQHLLQVDRVVRPKTEQQLIHNEIGQVRSAWGKAG